MQSVALTTPYDARALRRLQVLRRAGRTRPEVSLVATPAGPAVLKDYGRCLAAFRLWVAPWLVRREIVAHQALCDLTGVPPVLGRPTPASLLIAQVAGARPKDAPRHLITPALFARLTALLHAIHRRGWVHMDVRNTNILVDADGVPHLIDLTAATSLAAHPRLRWWLRRFIVEDQRAVARLKRQLLPAALEARDHALLAHDDFFTRAHRRLRPWLRPVTKGLLGWLR